MSASKASGSPPDGARVELFDSHVHLDAPEFDQDRARVLLDARAAGVSEMLIPAVAAATWPKLHALCAGTPALHEAYGLHPCWMAQHQERDLGRLADWLDAHPAAAVGECGLDFADVDGDRDRQVRLLRGHFELAHRQDADVTALEQRLDHYNDALPPLKEFILPGGGMASAHCHIARTVCRRAERRVVTLMHAESVRPEVLHYLNRLSDLLFVLCRVLARAGGHGEVLWQHVKRPRPK